MSPFNSTLRVIVVIMGIVFFFAALAVDALFFGLGALTLFGLAFTGLTFSGIDPSAKSPEARRWFIASVAIGAFAAFLCLVFSVTQIARGNTKDAITSLSSLGWLLYVWHKYWHEIKTIIFRQSNDE